MKKFSFSLQTVLDFKNQYLDGAKNDYAVAQANVNGQQQIISGLENTYDSVNKEYNDKKAAGMDMYEMLRYDSYLKKIASDIEKEMKVLERLEKVLDEKFRIMVQAKQEVTSLDKLREKRFDAYNHALQKQEELFIEEFVSNKTTTAGM